MNPPYEVTHCSWPRPVEQRDRTWTSDPEWEAPAMPALPEPRWEKVGGERCWAIDWCAWFRSGSGLAAGTGGGEMRLFHVVFRIRARAGGRLVFWCDDGCVIRRRGEILHADRGTHHPVRAAVEVAEGDELEVAHWQYHGGWLWAARIEPITDISEQAAPLWAHRDAVIRRLRRPDGPPLKMFFNGRAPFRTALGLYSMVLNGYAPEAVLLYGDYQWSDADRATLAELLPFATVVPTDDVRERLAGLAGGELVALADRYWFVMKTCAGLLCPPLEYAFMDDDIFILNRITEALAAFRDHDLVFAPDQDLSRDYVRMFACLRGREAPLVTGTVNTGLYWLRNRHDVRALAQDIVADPPHGRAGWIWEQGFVASRFLEDRPLQLPTPRYFYPIFDGLPGGLLGYPYAENPCGFVTVHFGGLPVKPSEEDALALAPAILGRGRHAPL